MPVAYLRGEEYVEIGLMCLYTRMRVSIEEGTGETIVEPAYLLSWRLDAGHADVGARDAREKARYLFSLTLPCKNRVFGTTDYTIR